MPRTWYEKISKLLSSRRVAAIFLVLYIIRLMISFPLFDHIWVLAFIFLPVYALPCYLLCYFLCNAKKHIFAIFFVLFFVASSYLSIPTYFYVEDFIDDHIILPRIEEVAPEILNEYPPDTKVELKGFDQVLSFDDCAIVKDGCIWFMQSPGDATANTTYFVYTENPEPSEDYLTEHIYFENEEIVSESFNY